MEKATSQDVQERVQESQDASKALAKDASALARQAQALNEQARQTRAKAQHLRAQRRALATPLPAATSEARLTVAQACRQLGVCEPTLRRALREPARAARVQQEMRRAGTFRKMVMLLPADLVAELAASLCSPDSPA